MKQSGSEPEFDSEKWPVIGNNCYDYAFGDNRRRRKRSEPGGSSVFSLFKTCGRGENSMTKRILSDNPRNVYKLRDSCVPCKKGSYKVMSFVAPQNTIGDIQGDFHFYKQVGSVRYQLQVGDTIKGLAKFFRVKISVIREALRTVLKPRNMTNGLIDDSSGISSTSSIHRSLAGVIIKFPVNLWAHKLGWGTRPLLVDASGRTICDPRKADRKYAFNYKTLCGTYCVRAGKAKTGNS